MIVLNQIGYKPGSIKRAIYFGNETQFEIVDYNTKNTVFKAEIEQGRYEELASETCNYCDFSAYTTPGKYYIKVGSDISYSFEISDGVFKEATELVLKCYYYNRCGCAIHDEKWNLHHEPCHTGNAIMRRFTGELDSQGRMISEPTDVVVEDVLGGWHDAGDYGRYVPWECSALVKMMEAYRINPSLFSDDTGIPESGNGIPDILDEARYTLEWLLKLQREDGAFYHKLTSWHHAGMVSPENDTKQFFLWPVSVDASISAAAALSMAARVFEKYDPKLASRCLKAALGGYEWARANAETGAYPAKEDSETGNARSGDLNANFAAAAASLYMTTGEAKYHDEFKEYSLKTNGVIASEMLDYILNEENRELDREFIAEIAQRFAKKSEEYQSKFDSTAFEFTLHTGGYANMMLMGNCFNMIVTDMLTGSNSQRIIEENVNYALGKNALGYCGILGMGSKQIEHAHLRFPTPGWITGGATSFDILIQRFKYCMLNPDGTMKETRISENTPPLKCYVDEFNYFYINEPTISCNANALFTFAYLCK